MNQQQRGSVGMRVLVIATQRYRLAERTKGSPLEVASIPARAVAVVQS